LTGVEADDSPFVGCTPAQQQVLVEAFGWDGSEANRDAPRFFRMLKEFVFVG